jgi:hypothetical protein
MTSDNRSKFALVAGPVLAFSLLTTMNAAAQGVPTEIVSKDNEFGLVTQRPAGDRDPNGPEFVVRFSTMFRGDMTYDEGGLQGRAIDCDTMVAKPDGKGGYSWYLTGLFLAKSLDIADGSSFDSAFKQGTKAVVGAEFINSYKVHIDQAHHPITEQDAVAAYCNVAYPPTNDK